MVARARRNAAGSSLSDKLRFEALASQDLVSVAPGRFDLVFFYGSLEHIGEQGRAIEQAAALLRPGGLLVVATLHALHPRGLLATRSARRGTLPPVRLFRRRQLRGWAARCGLVELPLRFAGPAGLTFAAHRFRLHWAVAAALMPILLGNLVLVFRPAAPRRARPGWCLNSRIEHAKALQDRRRPPIGHFQVGSAPMTRRFDEAVRAAAVAAAGGRAIHELEGEVAAVLQRGAKHLPPLVPVFGLTSPPPNTGT